jgi:hypothetical protein
VTYRNNLKELDDITLRLNQRLHASEEREEHHQDSEGPMPLSTSSALITCGSTSFDGTWGFHSTMPGDRNGASSDAHQMPDALASTVGSAATTDAVAEMMRCTLERTGSSSGRDQPWNLQLPPCDDGSSGGSSDLTEQRDVHSNRGQNRCDELRMPSATDMDHYVDSLKHAQDLLQQLNIINNGCAPVQDGLTGRPPNGRKLNNREHTENVLYGGDDDDDVEIQEDEDTLANIWAMRQSRARNDSSNSEGSLDSTVEQGGGETSYVSPRTLNDLPHANGDSMSAAAETGGGEKSVIDSGDTWFVDVLDARSSNGSSLTNNNNNNNGNCSNSLESPFEAERQRRINGAVVDAVDTASTVLTKGKQSSGGVQSPSGIQPHACDARDDGDREFPQQKVKPTRRSAMHRRETRRQPLTSSSSASDDECLETMAAASAKRIQHSQPRSSDSAESSSPRLPRSLPVTSRGRQVQSPVSIARNVDDTLADVHCGVDLRAVNHSPASDSDGPTDQTLSHTPPPPTDSRQYPFLDYYYYY